MPQRVPTREELQQILSSLLIACKESSTCGVPIARLDQEYKEQEGMRIPFRELGYPCLVDLLRSMSSSLLVGQRNGYHVVYPIVSERSAHISSLVAGQKVSHKRPRGGRRPVTRGAVPWYPHVTLPPRRLDSRTLGDVVRMAKNRRDGVPISEVLRYVQTKSNGSFELQDLMRQLREIRHEVVAERGVVYSVSGYQEPARPARIAAHAYDSRANNNIAETSVTSCISAAGNSDREDDEEDFPRNSARPATHDYAATSARDANGNVRNEDGRTKNGTTQAKEAKNVDERGEVRETEDNDKACEDYDSGDPENVSALISERTKFRLEKLVQKHPEGIWCADLPDLYEKEYKMSLNYEELGFGSVSAFAVHLPEVFHMLQPRDKGDFKLFDAKAAPPNLKPSGRQSSQTLAAYHNIYDSYGDQQELPVPVVLPSEASQRLIPDGVMTVGETVPQISVTELHGGENEYIDVLVVELFTPSFFWIQLLNRTIKFGQFMHDLHVFYTINAQKYAMPIIVMEKGLNCACQYDNKWHRGMIKTVQYDNTVTVLFYDYGTVQSYPPDEIHFLHRTFSSLPAQAIPCGLYNVKPRNTEKWSKSAAAQFSLQVMEKPLVATIGSIDTDNNSMLIGLTNTEGTEDFHINDWMVQNGLAVYGKMVCIRPPNYPFRRFLECEYDVVNRSRTESTRKLSKIVELTDNNEVVESPLASRKTDKNLEWYRVLLELRRSAKSSTKQPDVCDVAVSISKREDPKIPNVIESRTDKNSIPSLDKTTNDDDAFSKFSTGLFMKMCKNRAKRNASKCETLRSSPKSVASSSSSSILVPEKATRDRKVDNAELKIKDDDQCEQNNSLGNLPLHLKEPQLDVENSMNSEFGNLRSLRGGHGRMEPIDWNKISGAEATEMIAEELTKQRAKKSLPNEIRSARASAPAGHNKLSNQRDARSSSRSFSKTAAKIKEKSLDNAEGNEVSATLSIAKHRESKMRLSNIAAKSGENSPATAVNDNEVSTSSGSPKHPESEIKVSNIGAKTEEKSLDVAEHGEISTTSSTPKLPPSKMRLWNMAKKSTERSSATDEYNEVTTSPTAKFPKWEIKLRKTIEKSKTKNPATDEPTEKTTSPTANRSVFDIEMTKKYREEKEEKGIAIGDFHSPLGGRGQMAPVEWSDVLSPKNNVAHSSRIGTEVIKNISKPKIEPWTNLPSAKKGFLRTVNCALPKGCSRHAAIERAGIIRITNHVPTTVKRALKRLDADRCEKRPRLMIPDEVLEYFRDSDDGTDLASSSNAPERRAEPPNTTVRSNDIDQSSFDAIVRESESSNSPRESSKLNTDASLSMESHVSADKDRQDLQTMSDEALNTSPEILQSGPNNLEDTELKYRSSISTEMKANFCTASAVAEPNPRLMSKLSELIAASHETTNDSVLDSDDLSRDDVENEWRTKSTASSEREVKDAKNRTEDSSSERREFQDPTLIQSFDSTTKSLVEIDKLAVPKEKNNESPKTISVTEKSVVEETIAETKASETSHTIVGASALQLTKKSQSVVPVFDDREFEENDDDDIWDFSPFGELPDFISKSLARGEDIDGVDDGEDFKEDWPALGYEKISSTKKVSRCDGNSGEDRPLLEIPENNSTKEVSSCDKSSAGKSEENRPLLEIPENNSTKEVSSCDESSAGNSEEERPLLEGQENDSTKEVSDCDESNLENPEDERPLLESSRNDSSIDGTSCDGSSSEISHVELETDSSESSRREIIDDKNHERNDESDDKRKNGTRHRNHNIALRNISKLRSPSRLMNDLIGRKARTDDSDERFSSNDKLFTCKPVVCGNDIEKIASPYSILSEVKKSKISAVAKASTGLENDSTSEASSGSSLAKLISALKHMYNSSDNA